MRSRRSRVLTGISPSFHASAEPGAGAVILTLYFCPCSSQIPVPLQTVFVLRILSICLSLRSTAFGRISQLDGHIAKPEDCSAGGLLPLGGLPAAVLQTGTRYSQFRFIGSHSDRGRTRRSQLAVPSKHETMRLSGQVGWPVWHDATVAAGHASNPWFGLIRVGFVGNVFACLADHAKAVLDAEGEVASKQEGKRVKAYRKKQRQDE